MIEQTWMQMEESLPMQVFLRSLESLEKIRGEFDHILTGHTRKYPEDASLCEAQRRAVEEVLAGKNEDDMPYEWYGGLAMAHPYGPEPRRIVYRRNFYLASPAILCYDIPKALTHSSMFLFRKGISPFHHF